MAFCSKCGKRLEADDKFCQVCGTKTKFSGSPENRSDKPKKRIGLSILIGLGLGVVILILFAVFIGRSGSVQSENTAKSETQLTIEQEYLGFSKGTWSFTYSCNRQGNYLKCDGVVMSIRDEDNFETIPAGLHMYCYDKSRSCLINSDSQTIRTLRKGESQPYTLSCNVYSNNYVGIKLVLGDIKNTPTLSNC